MAAEAAPTPVHHQIVVFAGPSLSADEINELFPDVLVLPPICQGDLLSAWEMHRPEVCVIVDGEFGQSLSVWHKEILFVLHQGVHVVGASSMGALRAAEMERFGMVGVGEIFAHYSGGFLTADEDVALLHGDEQMGWQPFTWPMVNCWATLRHLEESGQLDQATSSLLEAALRSLHFSRRITPALAAELEQRGRSDARELAALFADNYVDQKRLDAIAGINYGCSLVGTPVPDYEEPLHLFGRVGESMWESDTLVPSATTPLRRYELVNDFALHERDFEAFSQRALDRLLVLEYAFEAGVEASADDIANERARFLGNRDLTEETLETWLIEIDLDEAGFTRLIREEAVRRRMQRWGLDVKLYGRNRQVIIDQLRLEGRYSDVVRQSSRRRAMTNARTPLPWPSTDREAFELVIKHHLASGWRAQLSLEATAEDHGFESLTGLLVALLDAAAARQEASERRERLAKIFAPDVAQPMAPTLSQERTRVAELHRTLELHQLGAILGAAVDLKIAEHLAQPLSNEALAAAIGADADRLSRLCLALVAIGVLEGNEEAWVLSAAGSALAEDHPASLAPYSRDMRAVSIPAWNRLGEVVRGADPHPADGGEDADRAFAAATWGLEMEQRAASLVQEDFDGTILDLGGGLGRLALALTERAPKASVVLAERPEVVERSRDFTVGSGILVTTTAELAQPVDLAFMTRVLCTMPDDQASGLLSSLRAVLVPGGSVHVIDAVLDGTAPTSLVDLFNLVRGGGGARSAEGWDSLASSAGLELVAINPFSIPFSDIVFRRPDEDSKEES